MKRRSARGTPDSSRFDADEVVGSVGGVDGHGRSKATLALHVATTDAVRLVRPPALRRCQQVHLTTNSRFRGPIGVST